MTLTPEQHAAIFTHDRPLIVTAGAGSGKTFVLVERFMALLDANPAWPLPSIAAITFTEKAAREMRDRVRAALEARLQDAAARGDMAALDRWVEAQAALTTAPIGTIHALCARLLRANPAEAGIDLAFQVLDETEAAILRDDAVAGALARLADEDRPGARVLAAYEVSAVRGVLQAYAPGSMAAAVAQALAGGLPALLDRWNAAWPDIARAAMHTAQADPALQAALAWTPPSGVWPDDDRLLDNWRLIARYLPDLLGDDPGLFKTAMAALAEHINLSGGRSASWGSKAALDECKAALRIIRETLRAILADLPDPPGAVDFTAAEWLLAWGDAIRLVADLYAALKRERAALDFDDLETLARNLLIDHPAVAARHAAEFNQVLVDEFQDTNAAQRDLIYQLSGMDTPGSVGRLFVVGDPKQSIYAFRGADVSVFGAVRDDLLAWGGAELPLAVSFRAHEALVDALNDLFGLILGTGQRPPSPYDVTLDHPLAAHRPADVPEHIQPLTVFAFPRPDKDAYPDFTADDIRRWEAWTLAGHIHELVRRGVPVWDRALRHDRLPQGTSVPAFASGTGQGAYRPVTYGDVAVLFQSMTRVPLYEDVFKAANLPYVTLAGKGYYDRQEVWDLLNLLRALHNPADDLALAAVLRSPLFGFSDEALYALRLARDADGAPMSLWNALPDGIAPLFPLNELLARDFACAVLEELSAVAGRVPVADLLARALDLTGYAAVLTGLPDGARRRGNVEKLLHLARASGRISLGAFNAYARDLTAREVREGEAVVEVEGAVRLMSVHASKGLEFPVVVLADASWWREPHGEVFTVDPQAGAACLLPGDDPEDKPPPPFAWSWAARSAEHRDRAERRRLLYVGATRAQDYLVVSGSLYRLNDQAWLSQWLAALGLAPDALEPSPHPAIYAYPWGRCAVFVPPTPPPPDVLNPRAPVRAAEWDHPALRVGDPVPGVNPIMPPLLAPLPLDPQAPARHLSATHLAKLGRAPYTDPPALGYAAFRHAVLHDTPDALRPRPGPGAPANALRLIVGEMVHRALQVWALPGTLSQAALTERLAAYAVERGLSDPVQVAAAVDAALDLLARFAHSDLRYILDRAQQVYRELPFIYQAGRFTVHGVIDVAFFSRDQWHILDYKTAPVSAANAPDNAKRYYLQVGVYAAALEAHTGQTPQVHLYYIHPGRRVRVDAAAWRAALERLPDELELGLGLGN